MLGAMAVMMSGCTTDFDPDYKEKEVAVLNVLINDDETVSASVSHSYPIGDAAIDYGGTYKPITDAVIITDAGVELFVNGESCGRMTYDAEDRTYDSDVVAKAGDRVEIKAVTEKYGDVYGAETIPEPPHIVKIVRTITEGLDENSYSIVTGPDGSTEIKRNHVLRFSYDVTLADDGASEDFYMLGGNMDCDDPIFGENQTVLDKLIEDNYLYIFRDKNINGREYTLKMTKNVKAEPGGNNYYAPWEGMENRLEISRISKSYFLYKLSLFRKYEGFNSILLEYGIGNDLPVYSNIRGGGTGIMGTRSAWKYTDDVSGIVDEYIRTGVYPKNSETIYERKSCGNQNKCVIL